MDADHKGVAAPEGNVQSVGDSASTDDITARVRACAAPQSLLDYSHQEFTKQVYQVCEGVHVAVGYALANSVLLEGPAGVVIVDTTESVDAMAEILDEFRRIVPDKPVRGIIYTHSHGDHFAGTKAILPDENEAGDVEIWAHQKFTETRDEYNTYLKGVMTSRNVRQFGVGVSRVAPSALGVCAGIGPRLRASHVPSYVPPNRVVAADTAINIAGLELELLCVPGETADQLAVWLPGGRVLLPADNYYAAFPNLYAIRGTVPRSVLAWAASLDKMRALRPRHLVPSHTRPVSGEEEIWARLTTYRDAIVYVHDQTCRLLNRGLAPAEAAARAGSLPPPLARQPHLQEFYGRAEWSSRAVADGYLGWFSGAPEELLAITPAQRAQRMTRTFGANKLLEEARSSVTSDPQWALELASHVFLAEPENPEARELRSQALLNLAATQTSTNGRHYLLSCALEDARVLPAHHPASVIAVVRSMPLHALFRRMGCILKAEDVVDVTRTVIITLSDLDETYTFFIRNCILEVQSACASPRDVFVTMTTACLREIVAGTTTVQDAGQIQIAEGSMKDLKRFFSYMEIGETS